MTIVKPGKHYRNRKQRTIGRLEKWAAQNRVCLTEIPTAGSPTADYKATFPDGGQRIFVEVKEIATEFEVKDVKGSPTIDLPGGEDGQGRWTGANHVRNQIKKAGKQLQPHAARGQATLLLIGVWNQVIDRNLFLPLEIPNAMWGGGPRIHFRNTGLVAESVAHGGSQAAGNVNRSISAIGRFECLEEQKNGEGNARESIIIYRHENPRVAFPLGLPGIRESSQLDKP